MLQRFSRSGARITTPSSSICWRCILEQDYNYRPFLFPTSRRRKSTTSEKKEGGTAGTGSEAVPGTASKQKAAKSQGKPSAQQTKVTGQDGAATTKAKQEQTSNQQPAAKGQKKGRVIEAASHPEPAGQSKTQQERKTNAREQHQQFLKTRRKGSPKNLHIRRIASKGKAIVRSQAGRSRVQRHLASAQRKDRQNEDVEEPEEGLSLKDAMQGKAFEDGKGGPTSTTFKVKDLTVDVINRELGLVPRLAHGLQRVLFNRGVVQFRDLHSRVYNFDPALELLPPVDKVDFKSLTRFTPPSKDKTLAGIAKSAGKKYVGSTSSLTGLLKHFHFLLSKHRDLNFKMMSMMNENPPTMTKITKSPEAVFLKYKDGMYSVDADKEHDSPNVLSLMGTYLEKYFTADKKTFEKFKVGNKEMLTKEDLGADAYHYSTVDDFLMRSQLDAYDPRLPGTGMFDLKTRAVLPIRMDNKDFEWGMDYEIHQSSGMFSSYEREMTDMARATMLKYSLQARIGRMDGIFVAYHNIARVFGFQYISIDEMDHILHGQEDRSLGDQEFVASMHLLNDLVNKATERFPEQSLRLHVDMPKTDTNHNLYFFAEPVTDEQINDIQSRGKEDVEDWERELLGYDKRDDSVAAPLRDENSIFVNLASETDKFRARARKIAEDRKSKKDAAVTSGSDGEAQHTATPRKRTKIDELLAEFGLRDFKDPKQETGADKAQPSDLSSAINPTESEHAVAASDAAANVAGSHNHEAPSMQPDGTVRKSELGRILSDTEAISKPKPEQISAQDLEQRPKPEPNQQASQGIGEQPDDQPNNKAKQVSSDTANEAAAASAREAAAAREAANARKAAAMARRAERKAELEALDKKPLIALQLRTTNIINGRSRLRPEHLTRKDDWKIAYSITEIAEPDRKWRMYEQTMRKRKTLLQLKEKEERAQKKDYFLEIIKKATKDGGSWRQRRDHLDRLKEEGDQGVQVWDREEPVKRGEYKVLSREAAP